MFASGETRIHCSVSSSVAAPTYAAWSNSSPSRPPGPPPSSPAAALIRFVQRDVASSSETFIGIRE